MVLNRSEQALRYVNISGEAIDAVRNELTPDQTELTHMAALGISSRIDREMRKVHHAPPTWLSVTPHEVSPCATAHLGLLVALGSHPDGFVREAAVDRAGGFAGPGVSGSMHSPGPAGMVAQRIVDPVVAVRERAQSIIQELLEAELERAPVGWLLTNVEVVVSRIVGLPRSVVLCPLIVSRALDLLESEGAHDLRRRSRLQSSSAKHRQAQILHHLRRSTEGLASGTQQAEVGSRLIDWHTRSA